MTRLNADRRVVDLLPRFAYEKRRVEEVGYLSITDASGQYP
jgi:hypothetical protein